MDNDLRRLIRRNKKIRQYLDGYNIDPEEFNIFELVVDKPPIIEAVPISSERMNLNKKERNKWN